MSAASWFCPQSCRSLRLVNYIWHWVSAILNSKQANTLSSSNGLWIYKFLRIGICNFLRVIVRQNKRVLFFWLEDKRFHESRYEIQGFFAYVISQKPSAKQQKKFRNIVYLVKLSLHAKIQLLLNTFKNGRKIKGSFFPWAFQFLTKQWVTCPQINLRS